MEAQVSQIVKSWLKTIPTKERLEILEAEENCMFYKVNCIKSTGISSLRKRLISVALSQSCMKEKVPQLYSKLLEIIKNKKKNMHLWNLPVVQWEEFQKWSGFEDNDLLERATQLLHDWGELVCFLNVDSLKHLVILDPQWLTTILSTIIVWYDGRNNIENSTPSPSMQISESTRLLSSEKEELVDLEEELSSPAVNGIIKRSDLPLIWKHYNQQCYSFFEELLERFGMWIPLEDKESFLVPCLLPPKNMMNNSILYSKNSNKSLVHFNSSSSLRQIENIVLPSSIWNFSETIYSRSYRIPFELLGFFHRMLVKILQFCHAETYWNTGAILKRKNTRALVELVRRPTTNIPYACSFDIHVQSSNKNIETSQTIEQIEILSSPFEKEEEKSDHSSLELLTQLVYILHDFLVDWYDYNVRDKIEIQVPCNHCLSKIGKFQNENTTSFFNGNMIHMFDVNELLTIYIKEKKELVDCPKCGETNLEIKRLLPEISIMDGPADFISGALGSNNYEESIFEESFIGEGSTSKVYLAFWKTENKYVAVKKLKMKTVNVETFLQFCEEVTMMKKLKHENILEIYHSFLRPLAIISEYMPGGTLDEAISKFDGPHNWKLLYKILLDISKGMAFLHSQKPAIYNRDLRTMNCKIIFLFFCYFYLFFIL